MEFRLNSHRFRLSCEIQPEFTGRRSLKQIVLRKIRGAGITWVSHPEERSARGLSFPHPLS